MSNATLIASILSNPAKHQVSHEQKKEAAIQKRIDNKDAEDAKILRAMDDGVIEINEQTLRGYGLNRRTGD